MKRRVAIAFVLVAVVRVWSVVACRVSCEITETSAPPVCGSDGVTYGSICLLLAKQCRDPLLRKRHEGKCDDQTQQEFEAAPVDVAAPMVGSCSETCNEVSLPICGLDNVTYHNPCHFKNAWCEDHLLKIAHLGPCMVTLPAVPAFCSEPCSLKQLEYEPTCASDGMTYYNTCAFKTTYCSTNQELAVVHEGPCT